MKKETLDASLQSMVGTPVIIKHQNVTKENADKLRIGTISKAYFNEPDGWFYCEGIIWDDKAQDLIENKNWSVSCSYDFLAYNDEGGEENNIHYDKEFTNLNFTHLAIVDNPRYERANIVFNCKVNNDNDQESKMNEQSIKNGFITIDGGTEDERVVWIPENVHWVSPKARNRVKEIIKNFEKDKTTKYDFSHTRVKPTEEQVKLLKDTVSELERDYNFKKIAQVEISSELNSGSWGVCFSPDNTSIISLAPSMYKENAQEKYDASVASGFHPKGTGDAIKSVFVHELGHAITVNSGTKEFWDAIGKIRGDYLKNITKEDVNNPDFISNYARTNKYEFVAEAFCQGKLSKKFGKYTKQVMEEIDKHFKHGSKSKVSNASEDLEFWVEEFGFGYPIDEDAYEEMQKEETKLKKSDNKTNNSNDEKQDKMILNALKSLITAVENAKNGDEKGKWVTIKGNHIFIPDGKTLDEVIEEKGWGSKKESKISKDIDAYDRKWQNEPAKWGKEPNQETQYRKEKWEEAVKKYEEIKKKNLDWDVQRQDTRDALAEERKAYKELELARKNSGVLSKYETLDEQESKQSDTKDEDTEIQEALGNAIDEFYSDNVDVSAKTLKKLKELSGRDISKDEVIEIARQVTSDHDWDSAIKKIKKYKTELYELVSEASDEFYGDDVTISQKTLNKINKSLGTKFSDGEINKMLSQNHIKYGNEFINKTVEDLLKKPKNKTNNSKEKDMAILEELKKFIFKVENEKENEMDSKSKILSILNEKDVDEETIEEIKNELEKIEEEKKEVKNKKKVKNEEKEEVEEEKDEEVEDEDDEEDKKEVKEVKEEVKEDVDNKCKNSKEGTSSFDKINEIYNSVRQLKETKTYVSRQEKLDNAVEYFK